MYCSRRAIFPALRAGGSSEALDRGDLLQVAGLVRPAGSAAASTQHVGGRAPRLAAPRARRRDRTRFRSRSGCACATRSNFAARHVELLAAVGDQPGQLRHLGVDQQLRRRLDVDPRLVVAFELALVERAPVARVADEPALRDQLIGGRNRLGVAAEIGERAHLAEQRVDGVRLELQRPVVEGQRALELLGVIATLAIDCVSARPLRAPRVRLLEAPVRLVQLALADRVTAPGSTATSTNRGSRSQQRAQRLRLDAAADRALEGDQRRVA